MPQKALDAAECEACARKALVLSPSTILRKGIISSALFDQPLSFQVS